MTRSSRVSFRANLSDGRDLIGPAFLSIVPAAAAWALGAPDWAVGLVLVTFAVLAVLGYWHLSARVIVTDPDGGTVRIPSANSSLEDIR
jgi:hypothetical protein